MPYTYKRKKKNSAYRKKVRKTQRGGAPLALASLVPLATRLGPKAVKFASKNPELVEKALSMGMGKGRGNLTELMKNPKLKTIANNVFSSLASPSPAPAPAPAPAPVKPEQLPTENKVKGGSKRRGGGTCSYANGGAKKSKRKTKRNKRTRKTRRNSRK